MVDPNQHRLTFDLDRITWVW